LYKWLQNRVPLLSSLRILTRLVVRKVAIVLSAHPLVDSVVVERPEQGFVERSLVVQIVANLTKHGKLALVVTQRQNFPSVGVH
jgi:hypothetical protein